MQRKVCILVILATLGVALLVAPVAANGYEAGVVPGGHVYSDHQNSDGYVPAAPSVHMSNEAKATVYVYQTPRPAPRHRKHPASPRPRVKRPAYHASPRHTYHAPKPSWVKPKPKGKPFMTNRAGGGAFGMQLPSSAIAVIPHGICVKVMKGIMSGNDWQWAQPGHTLPINRTIGSLLRFVIVVKNTDSSDLPTNGIYVSDDLAAKLPCRAENGAVFLGATKIKDLTPEELTELTSGKQIPIKRYQDIIPAGSNIGIRYDVRLTGAKGGSQDPNKAIVPTTDDTATTATGPSWWSKFDKRWLLVIPIFFLLWLIWWIFGLISQALDRRSANNNDDEPAPKAQDPPLVVVVKDEPALTMDKMEEAARQGAE